MRVADKICRTAPKMQHTRPVGAAGAAAGGCVEACMLRMPAIAARWHQSRSSIDTNRVNYASFCKLCMGALGVPCRQVLMAGM